jgi:hypothetical protein
LTYRPKFSVGGVLGLLFIVLILAVDAVLVRTLVVHSIRPQEINLLSFVLGLLVLGSLPAVAVAAYETMNWFILRYHLDRNGVAIRWLGTEQIIPLADVKAIVPGAQFGDTRVRRRGIRWPGHERGEGLVPGVGRTRFLSTRPLAEQLLLITPGKAFAISPMDEAGFLKGFEARRAMGPNRLLEREVRHAPWRRLALWTDQTAWALLGAALAVNLGLFGYLAARFPGLDLQLPLHFNNLGQADRIGNKVELFDLPIIGLIILGTNLALGLLLYRRERAGSYLLWGAAAAAQALFWLATFSIVP